MSYQVLARKWRPKTFHEMVGQEHVLQALINALDHDRLHHAYLFTGTRGVGKTTIARILAKCLNCEVGVSSEPCGHCDSCTEIAEGRFIDLIEVDAASRTKVEDTRDLLNNVQYAPTRARYKVYLIDEVHMLSTHSFNALLKTLEEPPPHVKFLLATTDPQKLPATILSRCLQFNLRNMTPEIIVSHLAHILEQEKITFEEPGLWFLARAADGSMRDALSLTDQAIAFGSGKLQEEDVRSMLGSIDQGFVYSLLEAVGSGSGKSVLEAVERLSQYSPDYEGALGEMLSLLHRIAVAQAVPEAIDNSFGDADKIMVLASQLTAEDIQLYYQIGLIGKRDIGLAADPRSGLEMSLLRMLVFRPQGVIQSGGQVTAFEPEIGPPDGEPELKKPLEVLSARVPQSRVVSAKYSADDNGVLEQEPMKHDVINSKFSETESTVDPVISSDSDFPGEHSVESSGTELPAISADKLAGFEVFPVDVIRKSEVERAAVAAQSADEKIISTQIEPEKGSVIAAPCQNSESVKGTLNNFQLETLKASDWPDLLLAASLSGIVYNVASHCVLVSVEDRTLKFLLDETNASLYNESQIKRIAYALGNYFNIQLKVEVSIGKPEIETPALQNERRRQERQAEAVRAIDEDPKVGMLLKYFNATLDRDSIQPNETIH